MTIDKEHLAKINSILDPESAINTYRREATGQSSSIKDVGPETESTGVRAKADGLLSCDAMGGDPPPPPHDSAPLPKNFGMKNEPSGKSQSLVHSPTIYKEAAMKARSASTYHASQATHDYGPDATPVAEYGVGLPTVPVEKLDEETKAVLHNSFRGYYSNLKMNDEIKIKTLEAYAKTGRIGFAAKVAGVCPQTIKNHLKDDLLYAEAWDFALTMFQDRLEEEAYARGVTGWVEPVFGKTGQIGTILKKSERIFELMLKRSIPEFRDKQQIDHNVSGGVLTVGRPLTEEEWLAKASATKLPQSTMKDASIIDVDFVEERQATQAQEQEDPPL